MILILLRVGQGLLVAVQDIGIFNGKLVGRPLFCGYHELNQTRGIAGLGHCRYQAVIRGLRFL
ncbi:MAG: hypothetical protein CMK02_00040 [Polycyclovorans sp.]|nr:hypothetical protein [Polycyclovorans sp.]